MKRDETFRPVPCGLRVNVFEVGDDQFALFEWGRSESNADSDLSAVTHAERSVLDLVISGASNAHIAYVRGTSARTVANQIASLLRKLGASSRFELVRRYGRSDGKHAP